MLPLLPIRLVPARGQTAARRRIAHLKPMTRMRRRLIVLSSFAAVACKGRDSTPALGVVTGPLAPARLEDGGRTEESTIAGAVAELRSPR